MYLSISLLLLSVNLSFFSIRGRLIHLIDSLEYTLNIPIRMSFASFNHTNSTMMITAYRQKELQSAPRIVQPVNKTNSFTRRQNPCAHGEQEFVEKAFAVRMNDELMRRRNSQLKSYVAKKCANASSLTPCSFMKKVNRILNGKSEKEATTHFNSLRYTPVGKVCEGCKAITKCKFLNKTAVKDLLIRKFIGNTETNEIYTVDHRTAFLISVTNSSLSA